MRYDYDEDNIKGNYIFDNKDGWYIMKAKGYRVVTPVHKCSKPPHREHLTGGLTGKERCVYCREEVPEGVQALVKLHNWGTMYG